MPEIEFEETEFDIVSVTQTTARNLYELMLTLAEHIRKLEAENAQLKNQLAEKK